MVRCLYLYKCRRRHAWAKAGLLTGNHPATGSGDHQFLVQLLTEHIQREVGQDAVVVSDTDKGVIIDIRALAILFKVEEIDRPPPWA